MRSKRYSTGCGEGRGEKEFAANRLGVSSAGCLVKLVLDPIFVTITTVLRCYCRGLCTTLRDRYESRNKRGWLTLQSTVAHLSRRKRTFRSRPYIIIQFYCLLTAEPSGRPEYVIGNYPAARKRICTIDRPC